LFRHKERVMQIGNGRNKEPLRSPACVDAATQKHLGYGEKLTARRQQLVGFLTLLKRKRLIIPFISHCGVSFLINPAILSNRATVEECQKPRREAEE